MKVFIATWWTNYGEYVEVITASSEKHAYKLFRDKWNFDYEKIVEIDLTTFGIKFSGGGDLG